MILQEMGPPRHSEKYQVFGQVNLGGSQVPPGKSQGRAQQVRGETHTNSPAPYVFLAPLPLFIASLLHFAPPGGHVSFRRMPLDCAGAVRPEE